MNTEQTTLQIIKDIDLFKNKKDRINRLINKLQSKLSETEKDGLNRLMFTKPEIVFESIEESNRPILIPFLDGKIRPNWYIMTFPKLHGFGVLIEAQYTSLPDSDNIKDWNNMFTDKFFTIENKTSVDVIRYEFNNIIFDISIVLIDDRKYSLKGILKEAKALGINILAVSDDSDHDYYTKENLDGSSLIDIAHYKNYLSDYFGRKVIAEVLDTSLKIVLGKRKNIKFQPSGDKPDWHDHMAEMEYREYMSDERGDG